MKSIDPDSSPKPCDYFDIIGGTSTSRQAAALSPNYKIHAGPIRFIAIILGRLKMSINECISACLLLSDRVFRKKTRWVTIKGKI